MRMCFHTLCAVLTADEARDSSGDMGDGARFMMACAHRLSKLQQATLRLRIARRSSAPSAPTS